MASHVAADDDDDHAYDTLLQSAEVDNDGLVGLLAVPAAGGSRTSVGHRSSTNGFEVEPASTSTAAAGASHLPTSNIFTSLLDLGRGAASYAPGMSATSASADLLHHHQQHPGDVPTNDRGDLPTSQHIPTTPPRAPLAARRGRAAPTLAAVRVAAEELGLIGSLCAVGDVTDAVALFDSAPSFAPLPPPLLRAPRDDNNSNGMARAPRLCDVE